MKTAIFNQPFGFGDIIFIEPILRHYHKQGYKVVVPLNKQYLNIQEYFPNVTFINRELFNESKIDSKYIVDSKEEIIFPIRWSKEYFNSSYGDVMPNKYKMFNFPADMWRQSQWKRNVKREKELFCDVLKLKKGVKYNFINRYFAGDNRRATFEVKNKYFNVENTIFEDCTLFDWSMVIENASQIHTVETSIVWMVEILKPKGAWHLYNREGLAKNFNAIDKILSEKWLKHITNG